MQQKIQNVRQKLKLAKGYQNLNVTKHKLKVEKE